MPRVLLAVAVIALIAAGAYLLPRQQIIEGPAPTRPTLEVWSAQRQPVNALAADADALLLAGLPAGLELHFVAVAALGEHGRVTWLAPAHRYKGQQSVSLALEPGAPIRALMPAAPLDLEAGRWELCALFSAEALFLEAVEDLIESRGRWPDHLARACLPLTISAAASR